MQFINSFNTLAHISRYAVFAVLLPACSLVSDPSADPDRSGQNNEATSGDVSALGKNITDMVNVENKQASQSAQHIEGSGLDVDGTKTHNFYQDDKQQRLANVPKSVLVQYEKAIALMKQAQWQNANQIFAQILSAHPNLSSVRVNKAIIAVKENQLSVAIKELDLALKVNDNNPYAHHLKGQIARTQGQFSSAEQSYLKALTIWPQYPEVHVNMAVLLELYRGRLLEARTYYLSYLALAPEDVQVQRWLASLEIKMKRAGISIPEPSQKKEAS